MATVIKIPGTGIVRVDKADHPGETFTAHSKGWRGDLFRAGITRLAVRKNKSRLSPFQHTIDFDTTETGAKYVFFDATGDSYTVFSLRKGRQHVDYMSDRPNVLSVSVALGGLRTLDPSRRKQGRGDEGGARGPGRTGTQDMERERKTCPDCGAYETLWLSSPAAYSKCGGATCVGQGKGLPGSTSKVQSTCPHCGQTGKSTYHIQSCKYGTSQRYKYQAKALKEKEKEAKALGEAQRREAKAATSKKAAEDKGLPASTGKAKSIGEGKTCPDCGAHETLWLSSPAAYSKCGGATCAGQGKQSPAAKKDRVQTTRSVAAQLHAKVLSESHFGSDSTHLLVSALQHVDMENAECLLRGLNERNIQCSVAEGLLTRVLATNRSCSSELYGILCAQRKDGLEKHFAGLELKDLGFGDAGHTQNLDAITRIRECCPDIPRDCAHAIAEQARQGSMPLVAIFNALLGRAIQEFNKLQDEQLHSLCATVSKSSAIGTEMSRTQSADNSFAAGIDAAACGLRTTVEQSMKLVKKARFRVAIIGPMKAGKSTVVNTMVGIDLNPNRKEAMTQVPTVISHVATETIPSLRVQVSPYIAAVHILRKIARVRELKGDEKNAGMSHLLFRNLLPEVDEGTDYHTRRKDIVEKHMSGDVKMVWKQIEGPDADSDWLEKLMKYEHSGANEMVVTDLHNPNTAESNIRDWLTRINDLCRIATFFHADDAFSTAGLGPLIDHMFASEPRVEVRTVCLHPHPICDAPVTRASRHCSLELR